MIRHFIIICILFCQCSNILGQFLDDFSDSDLNSDPIWEGDVEDFTVTSDEMLQLNASDGVQSKLFTQINLPDSIQWTFEALLDFSPSANNRLRVYLAIDQINTDLANGYYFEIGENGGDDALNFYYLSNGIPELIASGTLGALGGEPAFVKVDASYFPNGEWKIATAYAQNMATEEEMVLIHDEYDFSGNQIFQLECNYTSSRSDKFFFDNIGIKKFEVDKEGPIILDGKAINPTTIILQFNEKLSLSSVQNLANYSISNYTGGISMALLNEAETEILLELNTPLSSGTRHILSVEGLTDLNGNVSEKYEIDLFLIEDALPGDLVVNEILFNPETGGSDFVEIFNLSNKFIMLGNLEIHNADKLESKPITSSLTINPNSYLCLSEDVAYLKDRYETPDTANFLEVDIPTFNNEDGNVSIVNSVSGEVIDSYDYAESQHFQQLEDYNGVSLERISPYDNKWFSASSSARYGTPGYRNSVYLNPNLDSEEVLSFNSKTFSPDQDGFEDQLIINYNLPENGYQVDITIFDQYGRLVRTLINNELFSKTGFVFWDGLNDTGESLDIGIYFVLLEAYNELGNVIKVKKPSILAEYFD